MRTFSTTRLGLAIFLHATNRLRLLGVEPVDAQQVRFLFSDPDGLGESAEDDFDRNALAPAALLFTSQRTLRRRMTEAQSRYTEAKT